MQGWFYGRGSMWPGGVPRHGELLLVHPLLHPVLPTSGVWPVRSVILLTSSPPHLITSSPLHLLTSSPPHLLTSSPLHLPTPLPSHLFTSPPPQALPSPGEQAVLEVEGCAAAGESDLASKLSRDYQEKQVYLLTPLLFCVFTLRNCIFCD